MKKNRYLRSLVLRFGYYIWWRKSHYKLGSKVRCQKCGRLLSITMTELAIADSLLCPYCSKDLTIEWKKSQKAMDHLANLQKEVDRKIANGESLW